MTDPQPDLERSAGLLARLARSSWPPALAVALLALAAFAIRLSDEPHFVDESAYISQAYYAALFVDGRRDDQAWLDYPAYDLPPLPKYFIGAALGLAGRSAPGPAQAAAWYRDTSLQFVSSEALVAARLPSVLLGVVGCLAVYGIGAIVGGRMVGLLGGSLLAVDPLYRMLARRAMSDVPCEAFMLLGLLAGLVAWSRWQAGTMGAPGWAAVTAAGLCAGLSLLCKFSGALTLMVLGAWGLLGLSMSRDWRSLVGLCLAGMIVIGLAGATFVALNPFMTARPAAPLRPASEALARATLWERWRVQAELRLNVAAGQRELFPHNALRTPVDKVATAAVQGFGRFGPLGPAHSDSTRRYDLAQDWGALIWAPCVLAGAVVMFQQGRGRRREGRPAPAWAVLAQFVVAIGVVTAYLPLAWDRYFLPLQAPASLLAASAFAAGLGRLWGRPACATREG